MPNSTSLPCGRPIPGANPLRLCKKTSVIFGKFAGGMCIDHALKMAEIDSTFVDQLHSESKVKLLDHLHREN